MRHKKGGKGLGKTSSHYRCMMANLLKSLIINERISTTLAKGKDLKRHADKMISLAKKGTLHSRRKAISILMIRFNKLTSKEARLAKNGNTSAYNDDRNVIPKLFEELGKKYENRNGGYTRIVRTGYRVGDNAERCSIEYL